jgi:hypothetical protein
MSELAVGPDGSVYSLGYDAFYGDTSKLARHSANGEVLETWTLPKPSKDVNIDEAGRVWLLDQANTRILSLKTDGTQYASWGEVGVDPGELLEPVSLAVAGGNVVVCDSKAIALFTETGVFKRNIVTFGHGQPSFEKIALNDNNILFATSQYADSVSMFDLSGTLLGGLEYDALSFIDLGAGPQGAVFLLTKCPDKVVKFHVQ